jgi:hypothetical protein
LQKSLNSTNFFSTLAKISNCLAAADKKVIGYAFVGGDEHRAVGKVAGLIVN